MDDGKSWIGIMLLGAAFVVYYLIYGFGAAVQALNTSALEDERDEGNKKAESLLHIQENPHQFVRTNQLITMIVSLVVGAYSFPLLSRFCAMSLSKGGVALSVPAKGALSAAVLVVFQISSRHFLAI